MIYLFFKKFNFKKEPKKKYKLKLNFKTCDPDYETVIVNIKCS